MDEINITVIDRLRELYERKCCKKVEWGREKEREGEREGGERERERGGERERKKVRE
jgi:hypothetical protein